MGNVFIAFIVAGFLNIYFLTKWKVLTQGKYFWLRSVGSSSLGIIFYCRLIVPLNVAKKVPFHEVGSLLFWSIAIKISFVICLTHFASMIVSFLKRQEGIDIYDTDIKLFNPEIIFRRTKVR